MYIYIYVCMYVYIYIYIHVKGHVAWLSGDCFGKVSVSACLLLKCQDVLSAQTLMYQIAEYSVQH